MVYDSTVLLIIAFALGFIASRCMSHQNILTGDVEEGSSQSDVNGQLVVIILSVMAMMAAWWMKCGSRNPVSKGLDKVKNKFTAAQGGVAGICGFPGQLYSEIKEMLD